MAESKSAVLDLLFSAGYSDARNPGLSESEKLAGGLLWCIAAVNASQLQSGVVPPLQAKIEVWEDIEKALRLIECPYPFQASQIQSLDYEGIYHVVKWIVSRLQKMRDEERDQNKRKAYVLNEIQQFQERFNKEVAYAMALPRQKSDSESLSNEKQTKLQVEIKELEEMKLRRHDDKELINGLYISLHDSIEKLNSAKRELAYKLREIVSLKRQMDDVPSEAELIQYEHRFSELNAQIQGKHRQTRKYYATFNTLLEIKELMLKETSLLNSISSQFQDAISSSDGGMKLVNSMEGILEGINKKLEKSELALHAEKKVSEALKQRYAAAISEQRQCSSLLKAFQEECAENERLRNQLTEIRK